MKNLVITEEAKQYGIEPKKASELTSGLATILEEREQLITSYKEVIKLEINEENIPSFRELRLKIRDNRTKGIVIWHKNSKEFFLAGGRFVDAIKNKEIAENERMEEKLMEGEKFFENQEKERLAELNKQRLEMVSPYLEDTTGLDLSGMEEDVFEAYLDAKKSKFEAALAEEKRIEEERIEAQRQKELEEKRIKEENERLKKEREIEAEKHRKAEEARKEKEKKEREEREAEAEKARKIQDKKDAEVAAQLKKEREAREKLEKEKKEREEAERLAEKKKIEEAEKLAKAPVKEKLTKWVNDFSIPENPSINETSQSIENKFQAFKKWAKSEIEKI